MPLRPAITLLGNQFKSPLVLILIGAATISIVVSSWVDAAVVLLIVLGSTLLGFTQEYVAHNALERMRSMVAVHSKVIRNGEEKTLPSSELKIDDLVRLSAGNLIPADGKILESNGCYVNQANLTGETLPVAKGLHTGDSQDPLKRLDYLFMGTTMQSGTALMRITAVGADTIFGKISERLELRAPMTNFEQGLWEFGHLLTRVMTVLLVIVLGVSILYGRSALDSFLFAVALAVGLTPELLPAITTITLSHGAKRMAKGGVIVRKLNAIENLGSMNVLFTDKTGTLTSGGISVHSTLDARGAASDMVLRLAFINAKMQSGMDNPMFQ